MVIQFWVVPLVLLMVVSYIIYPWLIKRVADSPSRPRSLIVFYFVNTILAAIFAYISGASFNTTALWVVVMGIANAFACYCHWRAIAISLSKTSIFTQLDDLTAIGMYWHGIYILGRSRLGNTDNGVRHIHCNRNRLFVFA